MADSSGSKLTGILPLVGPIFLALLAVTGVFARGLVNGAYAVLFLWGLIYLVTSKNLWWRKVEPLPGKYLKGLGLYFLALLLTTLTGSEYGRGFFYIGNIAYLLACLPLTWLALSQYPRLIRYMAPLYGLGLIVAGTMTFQQAGYCLDCVRAKASLGIIELGAVLGQLPPLMIGAWAMAVEEKNRTKIFFFSVVLVFSYAALINSCSRITLLTTPVLSLLMLWAHRNCFRPLFKLGLVVLMIAAAVGVLSDRRIVGRFQEMSVKQGNYNNDVRFNHWKQGLKVFLENPILGVGPRAIPNAPPLIHPDFPLDPNRPRSKYYHAHQVFLTVGAESGVVGLAGFFALHLAPLLLLWPSRKSQEPMVRFWAWAAAVVALQLFFNGLTDSIFSLKPLMYVYWTVTGTALWVCSRAQTGT
ncbi:MAG: O-antigen ligase family protein [Deltaproteobacteria bacterium]|nr:O-antigen ligase family protein [Deltaproteobacteria bacterium]